VSGGKGRTKGKKGGGKNEGDKGTIRGNLKRLFVSIWDPYKGDFLGWGKKPLRDTTV